MGTIIFFVFMVMVVIWAFRIESGLNKLNQTVERIEKHLDSKKEKK